MGLVTIEDIIDAAARVDGLVFHTPLLECAELGEDLGCRVLIKPENLQHTGSFKPRGALNTLLSWREQNRLPEGVVSFSAGNHAAAVAYAGRRLGVRAVVSMPRDAIESKVRNVRRHGGEVVLTDDLMGTCAELGSKLGYPALYPFDMPEIIAGQGTVGLEICADADPDLVLVPVGGGGLISGIATAVKARSAHARVVGVEPSISAALGKSMRAGKVVSVPRDEPTLADGLAAPFAGEHTLAQALVYVDDMLEVSEEAIREAWTVMMEETKLLLEPSAAVGLAALRCGAISVRPDETVVLVASGGNVDLAALGRPSPGPTPR